MNRNIRLPRTCTLGTHCISINAFFWQITHGQFLAAMCATDCLKAANDYLKAECGVALFDPSESIPSLFLMPLIVAFVFCN